MKKTASTKPVKPVETAGIEPDIKPKSSFRLTPPIITGLAVAAVLLGIAGYAYVKYWNVATVNGQPISRLEYIKAMEDQVGKQTLENMITETLVLEAAAKQNAAVDPAVINTEIGNIEKQLQAQGQTLESALAQEGMSKADLEKQIRIRNLIETMGQGDVNITDQQIDEFLTQNKTMLPDDKKPEELKEIAKNELFNQTKTENIKTWLEQLRTQANVVYQ